MENQHIAHEGRAPAPLLNTIAMAAYKLSVSRSRVYQLIAAGDLTAVKLGGKTVITEGSVQAFVNSLPTAAIGKKSAA